MLSIPPILIGFNDLNGAQRLNVWNDWNYLTRLNQRSLDRVLSAASAFFLTFRRFGNCRNVEVSTEFVFR